MRVTSKQYTLDNKVIIEPKIKRKHVCGMCGKPTKKNTYLFCSGLCKGIYLNTKKSIVLTDMTTATELGVVEGANFVKLEVGKQLELKSLPEITTSEKFNSPEIKFETTEGLASSLSKVVIGQLTSDNPKSVGGALRTALDKGTTLTVWVKAKEANTGRIGIQLSLFP